MEFTHKVALAASLICGIVFFGLCISSVVKSNAAMDHIDVLTRRMENQTKEMENQTKEMELLKHENQELRSALQKVQKGVEGVEDDVTTILTDQVRQDERMHDLEQNTGDLGITTSNLDGRMETQETSLTAAETMIQDFANGTSGLGGRVEALEDDTKELETKLTATKIQITGLDSITTSLEGRVETRLTAMRGQIEDLQETDTELHARITDLVEAGNKTIAFYAYMRDSDVNNIPVGSTVKFSEAPVNVGNGYNAATGVFTVPPGGGGNYFFSSYFSVRTRQYANIDLRVNDFMVCTAHDDTHEANDNDNTGCSAVVDLSEEDEVKNVYRAGDRSNPVFESSSGVNNGFTGFRI